LGRNEIITMILPNQKKSICLIGMPGVGKSFIGRNLAKTLNFKFIDTDDLIIKQKGKPLQQILDQLGREKFINLETKSILSLNNLKKMVISPGGSLVYSPRAVQFLKNNTVIIYLADSKKRIFKRIKNLHERGIVGLKEKGFDRLYRERERLYEKFADIKIDLSKMQIRDKDLKAQQVIKIILNKLKQLSR